MASSLKAVVGLLILTTAVESLRSLSLHQRAAGSQLWPLGGLWPSSASKKDLVESGKPPFRQQLVNLGDVLYSAEVVIGGQRVHAVVDTGSFEVVVLSTRCKRCGLKEHLYDANKSTSFHSGDLTAKQTYGSGTAMSQESWDRIDAGPSTVSNQVFWEVYDADEHLVDDVNFQMIMGVGPAPSAVKLAERELNMIRNYAIAHKRMGEKNAEWDQLIAHYAEKLAHTKNATQFVQSIDLKIMSICLSKVTGSNGVFVWNDHHPASRPQHFLKVPVTGDAYWSAHMSDVHFVKGEFGSATKLGCRSGCQAVVDSGTSLIAAPSSVVDSIWDALGTWADNGFDCRNISRLPSLEFKLAGQLFNLPPQSYVARMEGEIPEYLEDLIPKGAQHKRSSGESCIPMIMRLDEQSSMGPVWILGLPLFRQYYTSFVFNDKFGGDAMYFAPANDNCELDGQYAYRTPTNRSENVMRILASKLRVPQWALQSRALKRAAHSL